MHRLFKVDKIKNLGDGIMREEEKKGIIMAASFSWGCERANLLGISEKLKSFVSSGEKDYSFVEIKELLKRLDPYLCYLVIARSHGIESPFDYKVVYAHWIGSSLSTEIKKEAISYGFEEFSRDNKYDDIILGFLVKPLLDTKKAHHNFYVRDPRCFVTTDGNYFYHLGEKRWKASPKDIMNFKKYGRR